jgi:hypothetical protein
LLPIKLLFKVERDFTPTPARIRLTLATAILVTTLISHRHPTYGGVVVFGLGILMVWPKAGRAWVVSLHHAAFLASHSLNLILLAMVYFFLLTPLGIARRLTSDAAAQDWRQPPEPPGDFRRPY